jgi:hydrogenase maturation factor
LLLSEDPGWKKKMCITRLGRVLALKENRATIEFLDTQLIKDIDISMVKSVGRNSFVEVFGDVALGLISPRQAKSRQKLAIEIRKRAVET